MGVVINFVKDIFICICITPPLILLLLSTFIFWIWKTMISIVVRIVYRKESMRLVSKWDIYFLSVDNIIYSQPKQVLPVTAILEGDLGEKELKDRFQKEVIDFQDEKGNLVYERLQQKLVKKFGYFFLAKATNFNIDNHIRTVEIPLDEKSALEFIKTTTRAAFNSNSSMWEIIRVPNYNGENKTFILLRVHHAFMDGFSILSILKRVIDGGDEIVPSRTASPTAPMSLTDKMSAIYRNTIGLPRNFYLEQSSRRNLIPTSTTKDFFVEKTGQVPLSLFKGLKAESDISFTLAVTTALSAALSYSNVGRAMLLSGLDYISLVIPFPALLDGKEVVGNSFTLVHFNIPLKPMALEARIQKCREEMEKKKNSVSPKTIGLIGSIGNVFPAPIYMKYFLPKESEVHGCCISNMPGPQKACKFWGRNLLDISYLVLGAENPWVTVTLLSYQGAVRMGFSGMAHMFATKSEFEVFTTNFMKTLDNMFNNSVV